MSGQRSKKVRMGSSRHRPRNQGKTLEADDSIDNTDETPVAQQSIESLGDLAEFNSSKSGNAHLSSSEITGNRRKLASSRRKKGRQDSEDTVVKSYDETREEVVENTTCHKALFDKRSRFPPTVEIESASNQSLDFVEPDRSYKKHIHVENPSHRRSPETTCDMSTSCKEETDTVTVSASPLPQNMEKLPKQSDIFKQEKTERNDTIVEQRGVVLDEESLQDESKCQRSTLATERLETLDVSEQSWTPGAPNILQSRQDTLDRPEQNGDNDENPHIKSNLTGRRRKMGSSRRNLRDRHEEKYTEKMQEDETGSSEIIQERGGMTTEVNSSSERDDPIGSTERVGEDEEERSLKGELENRSELTGYEEPEITDFLQSQTTLFHKEEDSQTSDIQNVSDYGDKGNMNSRQDTLDVLNQDVSQDQNMDSMPTDTQAAREEAYLQQTNEVEEGLKDFTVTDLMDTRPKHDMEEEGLINAEVVSEKDDAGELFVETAKEAHKAQEINISYEDTYRQTLPAAHIENVLYETLDAFDISHKEELTEMLTKPETLDVSEQSWTPDAPNILQSRQDTLDRPEQNGDNDENPHIKSNLTGRRRKMGSSRRNLRDGHEEKNTEKMQEDETGSSEIIQERGGMTTEVNSSSERDDPIGSTERVGEDEKERSLKGELENRSELTGYEEPEITDFLQSQTTLFHKEEDSQTSDIQNVSDYGDKGNMNSRQDTLDVLNQDVSQDQNMDSMPTDTQAAREEAYLQQTNEVEEGLKDFTVTDLMDIRPKHDMEEEGLINAEVVSEKDDAGELFVETAKEAHKAQEINISYEDTYRQTLPAAHIENVLYETLDAFDISHKEELTEMLTKPETLDVSEQSWTPDAPNILQSRQDTLDRPEQNGDNDENPHIKSNLTGRRRKMGSSRRNLRDGHEEKNTEKMQEDETGSSEIIQERGGMTTEVNSSSERDDPIGSTERVGEDEKERSLKGELENRSELTGYEEPEITDFLQSQTTLFHKEEDSQTSDIQNVSDYGDKGNMNSRQDTLDVLNQDVSQDQNMDSMPTDTQAAREEAYLQQTNEVEEGLKDFTVTDLMDIRPKHDMEEEGLINAEVVSEKDDAGELFVETAKEAHKAQEINISYEDTYRQTLPAAHIENVLYETLDAFDISHKEELTEMLTKPETLDVSEQSWTPDAPNILQSRQDTLDRPEQNGDNDENPHIKSNLTGRRRKMGSSRRNLRDGHEEKNTEKMQEDETGSSEIIQEKRSGMTTEVNSSSERDDPIGSTGRVGEDEKERSLKGELENRSELTGYEEPEITDFLQSQTTLFHKEEDSQTSDIQNVSDYGDKGNMNSRQDTLDVLNQDVSQDQNMDSMPTDTQAVREEAYLEQTNEVEEGLEDFTVAGLIEIRSKDDMEEEGPVNTEVFSEKKEDREQSGEKVKEDHIGQDIYEETYSQALPPVHNENLLSRTLDTFDICLQEDLTEPAVHVFEQHSTSGADVFNVHQSQQDRPETQDCEDVMGGSFKSEVMTGNNNEEATGEPNTARRRKMGSTRRNLLHSKNVKVSEERLREEREVVEKSEVTDIASVSGTEQAETPVNPVFMPSDLTIKEEKGQQEVTAQDQEEAQEFKSEERSDIEMLDLEMDKSEDNGAAGEGGESALVEISRSNTPSMPEDDVSEQADKTTSEIETSRGMRRKMGSTRWCLGVRPKEENLEVRQEEATEVAEVAEDVEKATIAEHAFDMERIHPALDVKLLEDEFEKQRTTLLEAVPEFSHSTPMAQQSLSPAYGARLKVKVEGRRRKMGSTRRLQGRGLHGDPAENQGGIKDTGVKGLETITENVIKTSDDQERGKLFKVGKSDQRPPSNNDSDCLSQRAPGQPAGPRDRLVQERELNLGTNQFNVVMVGNSNVGKTSFIKRAENGEFCPDLSSSIGIDTSVQSVTVDGKTVVLQFWDTAGQERFRSITRQVFHRAQAFLLMYDITSSQSFCDVRYWVTCIQEGAADDIAIVLLGNKSDCAKREVDSDQAKALAKEHNMVFMECSAATGDNVIQSMEAVARMLSQRLKQTEEDSMMLHKASRQKKTSGCC